MIEFTNQYQLDLGHNHLPNPVGLTYELMSQLVFETLLRTFAPQVTDVLHDLPAVERRRRFNINDRIKELGTLLPKQQDQ